LVNASYPGLTGDHLNRYWTVSASNITGFSCDARFEYVPADVIGNESNISCIRIDPNLATYFPTNTTSHYLTANGLTSFGTFTGGLGAAQTGLTAFLQGPYNGTNHNMNNTLTTLPLGDRSDLTKFPNNQPYNLAPWNYSGTESVGSLPANAVDWVLVELRHAGSSAAATSITVLGRRAAFILKNGSIVDLDGTSLKFKNLPAFSDNLYIVVYHRNHMAIMAKNALTRDANQVYNYDYSTGPTQVYGGTNGYLQIDTNPGRWGMVAGDADANNMILGNDYTDFWIPSFNTVNKYMPADFNMDSNVLGNDYTDFWITNFNKINVLP